MNLQRTTTWLRTLLTLMVVLVTVVEAYDCRRKGQECKNSQTCDKGACVCADPYTGYNCDSRLVPLAADACSPGCQNGGTCVEGPRCSCPSQFYGVGCELNRVEVKCYGDRKIIHLNPEGFVGSLYVSGNRKPECTFAESTSFSTTDDGYDERWTTGWTLVLPDTSPDCGDVTAIQQNGGESILYERYIGVHYHPDIDTTLDEILTVKCLFTNNELRALPSTVVAAQVQNDRFQQTSVEETYEPVEMTTTSNNLPITAPLLIGSPVSFNLYVPATTEYEKLIVETIEANDGKDGGKTVVIITDKCVTADGAAVVEALDVTEGGRRSILTLTIFIFVGSDQVNITGSVRICKTGETACDTPTCPPDSVPPPERKRRASGDQKTIFRSIKVTDDPAAVRMPSSTTGDCKGSSKDVEDVCLQKNNIIAVLATMAAALAALMVACIVLTVKLLKKTSKVADVYPTGHQVPVVLPRLSPANF